MRNWVNLYEYKDKECPRCGTIPSQVIGKTVREMYTPKQRVERRKIYGNLLMCSRCVQVITDPPKGISVEKQISRPRGWKFMNEFVDSEGNVFHRGVEQKNLKGKLPITDVDAIKNKQNKAKVVKPKSTISKWKKEQNHHDTAVKIFKLKKQIEKLYDVPRSKTKIAELKRKLKVQTAELKKWK